MNIHMLSASERILRAHGRWDSVLHEADQVRLNEEQVALLDARLAALAADGNLGDTGVKVKRRITARSGTNI